MYSTVSAEHDSIFHLNDNMLWFFIYTGASCSRSTTTTNAFFISLRSFLCAGSERDLIHNLASELVCVMTDRQLMKPTHPICCLLTHREVMQLQHHFVYTQEPSLTPFTNKKEMCKLLKICCLRCWWLNEQLQHHLRADAELRQAHSCVPVLVNTINMSRVSGPRQITV